MHPQLFLKTFWRMELKPQIFVAMSFDKKYKPRFKDIIAPAIRSIKVDGVSLEPYRVDLSKTGDSILTDIIDGVAHSQLVLADVSSIGKDSITNKPYRNANVMYEVGLALACRQPTEVLLIRDDRDKFLFDVSTIPHITIDFTDKIAAKKTLTDELKIRIKERNYINDARVQLAIASLSQAESKQLKSVADYSLQTAWRPVDGEISVPIFTFVMIKQTLCFNGLLNKQLIKVVGEFSKNQPAYQLTPLGQVVAKRIKAGLKKFKTDPPNKKIDGE